MITMTIRHTAQDFMLTSDIGENLDLLPENFGGVLFKNGDRVAIDADGKELGKFVTSVEFVPYAKA